MYCQLLLSLDLLLHPLFQTSLGNLLDVRGQLADFSFPYRSVLLSNNDLGAANVPDELPASAASQGLAGVILEVFTKMSYQIGDFDAHQSIVDAVSAENVAEAAGNNKRDLLGQDRSCGLLAGATTAKVEATHQNIAFLGNCPEVNIVVLHAYFRHLLLVNILVGVLACLLVNKSFLRYRIKDTHQDRYRRC